MRIGAAAMAEHHIWMARNTAGRAAVVIASEHDRETARDMTCGLFTGFLLACAQYDGWDETLRTVQQIATASRVPAEISRPKLSVVQGGNGS